MEPTDCPGYLGKILRVDLTRGLIRTEELAPRIADQYLGGSGFGAYYLAREVPPGVTWDDPENRLILASGPLGGTPVSGTGTFSLVTKGPMTNLAVTTQANGFWGAYLRFAGFDGLIIEGRSPAWVYLHIQDGSAVLRDARSLIGKDTWQLQEAVHKDTGTDRRTSVFGIGVAGENQVRYAVVSGDSGHAASKNGCGCVMGAKRLKAIAVTKSRESIPLYDAGRVAENAAALDRAVKKSRSTLVQWGTGGGFTRHHNAGSLPVRNYTTNLFPEHEKMNGQYIRTHFEYHSKPCWACRIKHVKHMKVTEGPYTGYEGEEPEYECLAAWGPVIGNTDPGAAVMLTDVNDRLGMDANEAGYTIGWAMECYQKGLISRAELDGLDLSWGNVEAVHSLLEKISRREGIGDLLAEGVMRASKKIGRGTESLGVYVLKGATPRGHDHRAVWDELLDTCVSATGTVQGLTRILPPAFFGIPPITNPFSPWEIAGSHAKLDGWYVFVDCLGVCRFTAMDSGLTIEALNAATGRDLSLTDVMTIGRRVINTLRVFNFRHGLDPALEAPSPRYGSAPVDGPIAGKSISPYFKWMKSFYFELMGWDPDTGKPLPHTLKSLGLEHLID